MNDENKKNRFLSRLWGGDIPLVFSFWFFGVLFEWLIGLSIAWTLRSSAVDEPIFLVIFGASYSIFISIPIWRSANKYLGPIVWRVLAKILVIGSLLYSVSLVVGLSMFFALNTEGPAVVETVRKGDMVPKFEASLLSQDDKIITEASLLGEPFLLNVWASWVPQSRQDNPYLVSLAKQGVKVVGLNYKDERGDALTWLRETGNPYLFNIYDPKGDLGYKLGVYGAPETYMIDSLGVVRYRHVGMLNSNVWNKTLQPLMHNKVGQ